MRAWMAEPPPLAFFASRPFYPWLVVGITCTSAFIGQLDGSIVQLALPSLKMAFGTSIDEVGWVAIAYLLAFAASLPVFGAVCEIYGRKLTYLGGFALFSLASLLRGLTNDIHWLIALRVVQGVGGGLLGAKHRRSAEVRAGRPAGARHRRPHGGAGGRRECRSRRRRPAARCAALALAVLALNQVSVWSLGSPAMLVCLAAAATLFVLFVRRQKATRWPRPNTAKADRPVISVLLGEKAMAIGHRRNSGEPVSSDRMLPRRLGCVVHDVVADACAGRPR